MTKEHCCSVRTHRTMFLKLSVRFSSLLWTEITCQKEQQGYSSTVEIRQLFFNIWSGFSFGKGSTGRNTLNQYSLALPAVLTKSLSLKGAAQFSMRKKGIDVITFHSYHPLHKLPIRWSLCWTTEVHKSESRPGIQWAVSCTTVGLSSPNLWKP